MGFGIFYCGFKQILHYSYMFLSVLLKCNGVGMKTNSELVHLELS